MTLFHSHPDHDYDSETVRLAEEVAHRAALAVDNARLYRDAQEAVRLRDEFLSVASHELKTPLTPLSLKLTAVARELKPNGVDAQAQRVLRHLEQAHRQVQRLSTLINALLDVSNLSRGELVLHPEEMDLGAVLREVVAGLASEAARGGTEVRLEGPERVRGCWDRLRLEQIVTHLLSNAIRFGAGRPIRARLEQEDGKVRLVVHDEGIGIALEDQERIFGKFERAVSGRYYGGLGLGLYMTRSLVEAMGGSIRVESQPSEGATFTLELPREPRCQGEEAAGGAGEDSSLP
jgi:signal transduction histidine kinase